MKITILDPALCCNTGVCGPDVDDALIQTAANVKWLKSLGHEVNRHSISNDGAAFKEYPTAVEKLRAEGVASLPYIFINDELVKAELYPSKEEWMKWLEEETNRAPHNIQQNIPSNRTTETLIGIGAAVAASNEKLLTHYVSEAKNTDIKMEDVALAMNIGNEAKNSLSSNIISRANSLLKELHPSEKTCAPGSGCC